MEAATVSFPDPQDELQKALATVEEAEEKLKSLTAAHAPIFVAVERRSQALAEQMSALTQGIHKASHTVCSSQEILSFMSSSSSSCLESFIEKHAARRKTLLHHSSLLELLELPNLMDACIRGHLYDEAVNIAVFANTLERRHFLPTTHNPNPILSSVIDEIHKRQEDLERHLLARLQLDLTLPQCLEIVTCLRRLNGAQVERSKQSSNLIDKSHFYFEMKLQVDFLEARDVWLELGLNQASSQPSTNILLGDEQGDDDVIRINSNSTKTSSSFLDTIEVYRNRCFEIVTEFNAIFRSSTSGPSDSTTVLYRPSEQCRLLLSSWIVRRIQFFLSNTLDAHLTNVQDISHLRDIFDSVLFFAVSMRRVGADFSSLLPPLFASHLVRIMTSTWMEGLTQMEETLKVCRDAGKASPLFDAAADASAVDTTTIPTDPPKKILSYPPLARLVNAYLTSLNDLRRFLLRECIIPLRTYLSSEYIPNIEQVLKQNERMVLTPGFLQGKGDTAKNLRTCASGMQGMYDSCVRVYLIDALEAALGVIRPVVQEQEVEKEIENMIQKESDDVET